MEEIKPFRIFDLPSEVRSLVYASLLTCPYDISIELLFPWSEKDQRIQSQLASPEYIKDIDLVSYFCYDDAQNPNDPDFSLSLGLLRASKRFHLEASHILYSTNTFSFWSRADERWLAFLIFSQRLTNVHLLRQLRFSSTSLNQSWDIDNDGYFSKASLAAFRVINHLPNLIQTTFEVYDNLPAESFGAVAEICQELANTKCTLLLQNYYSERNCSNHAHHVPKMHRKVFTRFVQYNWRLSNEFIIVDHQIPFIRHYNVPCSSYFD